MRIKRGVNAVKKRRKIFKLAKGYFGCKSKNYRIARQAVMKSLPTSEGREESAICATFGLHASTRAQGSTGFLIPN